MTDKTHNADKALGSDDVAGLFAQSIGNAESSLNDFKYEGKGTTKLFGLIEMDSMIAHIAKGLWLTFAGEVTQKLSPRTYRITEQYAGKVLQGAALHRTAAGAALAVNIGLSAAPALGDMWQQVSAQRKKRVDAIQQVAPVLDDIVGSHAFGALHKAAKTNEVLRVYDQRLHKESSTRNFYDILFGAIEIAPNLIREGVNFEGLRSGEHRKDILQERLKSQQKQAQKQAEEATPGEEEGPLFDVKKLGAVFAGANVSIPTVLGKIRDKKLEHLLETRQAHPAFEMIVELKKQVESKPDARSFRIPGGRDCSLEQYIEQVLFQHQKDMSDLDANHTTLRPALGEDIKNAVKPIADGIRQQDISALQLIRLVGEGKVILNKGRGIADADEVADQVRQLSGKTMTSVDSDPKEYFANVRFTEEDAIASVKNLEGEERLDLCILLPDWLNKKAGLSAEEIKEVQSHRSEKIGEVVSELILAVNDKDDATLKQGGMSSSTIRLFRKAEHLIETKGPNSVRQLKDSSGASNIQQMLADHMVPKIIEDRTYLGTLKEKGIAKMQEQAPAGYAQREDHRLQSRGYAEREV